MKVGRISAWLKRRKARHTFDAKIAIMHQAIQRAIEDAIINGDGASDAVARIETTFYEMPRIEVADWPHTEMISRHYYDAGSYWGVIYGGGDPYSTPTIQ